MIFEDPLTIFSNSKIFDSRFGAYSNVGHYTEIRTASIGRYCSIASNCVVNPGQHPVDRLTTSVVTYSPLFDWYLPHVGPMETFTGTYPSVKIGHDVWIGAGVVIMGGLNIGNGAVIGAGAVVTKDVPPYSIVAGVPARHLRSRFAPGIAERVEELKWWEYDLIMWQRNGNLPDTRISPTCLDELHRIISSGEAPRIQERLWKVTFEGSASRIDPLPDPRI